MVGQFKLIFVAWGGLPKDANDNLNTKYVFSWYMVSELA